MQRTFRALLPLAISCYAVPLVSQNVSATFAGVRSGVGFFDTRHDPTRDRSGYDFSAYVGRSLAPGFAGVLEVGLAGVAERAAAFPCRMGLSCSLPAGRATALSLAPGLHWIATTSSARVQLALTAGAVWVNSPARGVSAWGPTVGERLEVSQLVGDRLRLGFSLGAQWWGVGGTAPRWVYPLGVTIGLR
jgi:hypothetical protein